MDWKDFIHSDPQIMAGKPVVKGTRISIDFILRLFAAGWTAEQVVESYPTITPDAIKAIFAFSAECMEEEAIYFSQAV